MPVTTTVRRLTQESGSEFEAYLSYAGHSRPFQATERCMWRCLCFHIRLLLYTRIYAWTWAVCGLHEKTLLPVLPHHSCSASAESGRLGPQAQLGQMFTLMRQWNTGIRTQECPLVHLKSILPKHRQNMLLHLCICIFTGIHSRQDQ